MVALTHTYGMNKPAYDAKLVDWARNATANVRVRQQQDRNYRWSWSYLSTQEQAAIARVAAAFDAKSNAPLAATMTVAGRAETAPDSRVWSRDLSAADLPAGVTAPPPRAAAHLAPTPP